MAISRRYEQVGRRLLEEADIQVGGSRPQDISIHDPEFYLRVLKDGTLGLGESYMDQQWDAVKLDHFIAHALRAKLHEAIQWNRRDIFSLLMAKLTNVQSRKGSTRVAKQHYDLKDILPAPLLDPYNQYTCAYFRDGTEDLNEAQEKKLNLICRKLQLSEKDRVLDIGCGWGGFAKYAAEHYGCHVTGISISEEQIQYAENFCDGLPVDIRYCDYRDLEGTYDKVLTCGMVEHVGYKNYRELFRQIHAHLADDGLYLLHTIGSHRTEKTGDAFLDKYIFPGGMNPSISQLDQARQDLFSLQDVQCLTPHYEKTLLAWYENFQANGVKLSEVYDNRFRRMFEFYLLFCAGAFRADHMQLWQMLFSKVGHPMDYRGAR